MKKIPTLFEYEIVNKKVVGITDKVRPGFEWVLEGKGTATIQWDGVCCAIIDGRLYKRLKGRKGGKNMPQGAIPCCPPDHKTGHHPHWVLVDTNNPDDIGLVDAFINSLPKYEGTYEAVGPDFRGNPHKLKENIFVRHGEHAIYVPRSFDGLREYLAERDMEGIVFWLDGEPQCKIKRRDFGLEWPRNVEGQ